MSSVKLLFDSGQYGQKSLFKTYTNARFDLSRNLYRKTLLSHYACVNSITFSRNGELFVSGGDDKRILLWNTCELSEKNRAEPVSMVREHYSNIFATVFDCTNRFIFSAGNDQQVLQHDIERREAVGFFFFDDSIYGIDSPYDNPHLFAASGEDGTVQVVDVRTPLERTTLVSTGGSYHSAVFNPIETQMVATANSVYGISLWDIRRPMRVLTKLSTSKDRCGMSVRFDSLGTRLLGLFRKSGPVLYEITAEEPKKHQFNHKDYRNICTMKSACFAGSKDQYVVAGSDDFHIYVWKIPEDEEEKEVLATHLVLQGHRSIVNQVRYNKQQHILASAGVEKCIKIWSCFPLKNGEGDLTNDEDFTQRQKYTREQYLRLTAESGRPSHDYDDASTEEDPRMIALFDSLIERTQTDWASDTTDSDNEAQGGRDSRVDTILNLLFDSYTSSSDDDSDNESSNTFGISIDELRRIFRRNRERTQTESPINSAVSDSPRTMINREPETSRTNSTNIPSSVATTSSNGAVLNIGGQTVPDTSTNTISPTTATNSNGTVLDTGEQRVPDTNDTLNEIDIELTETETVESAQGSSMNCKCQKSLSLGASSTVDSVNSIGNDGAINNTGNGRTSDRTCQSSHIDENESGQDNDNDENDEANLSNARFKKKKKFEHRHYRK